MTFKIAVLVGSLRQGSNTGKIAANAIAMLPPAFEAEIVPIGHLPLYNFDYDNPDAPEVEVPASYVELREAIKAADGILFVTPENNRTIPACLKNAVDIGSKPNSDVAWRGKPAGIISQSVGRMGGYSSQKNLRLALSYFDMPLPGQPEVFLGQADTLLADDATFNNAATEEFVRNYITRFAQLVEETALKA